VERGPCILVSLHAAAAHNYNTLWLLSALVWGSESRIYSHKVRMYVWWVTLRNVTWNVATYPIGIGHKCITQSGTFRYARLRCWSRTMMEMEVRDAVGPSRLGYYKHQTASPTANVTCATCASPATAYVYDARA